MKPDQLLQWQAAYDHVAARTRAIATAALDEVMAELGFERDDDGGWKPAPLANRTAVA